MERTFDIPLKLSWALSLSALSLAAALPAAQANPSAGSKGKSNASTKVRPVPKARAASKPGAVRWSPSSEVGILAASAPLSSYEQLRTGSRPTRVESLEQVRQFHPQLAGRTVELRARVAGVMGTSAGQRVLLQFDKSDGTQSGAQFDINESLRADEESVRALRPGARVRMLASVNRELAEPLVTPLAATDNAEAAPLFREEEGALDDGEVVIVPPMTSGGLPLPRSSSRPGGETPSADFSRPLPQVVTPNSPSARVVRPQAQRRVVVGAGAAVARPVQMDDADIDGQVGAYKALVRRFNKKLSEAQVEEIARALLSAGYGNGMDPRFLAAIIAVESDFNIYCLSSSGAMGLGQIMPFNLREAGMANKADAWNPTKNIHGTARLLRGHLNDYKGRAEGTLLAVAAYNAGPGAVRRAGYKVPNGKQVQRYVWKVYYRYKEFAPELFR
jgi:soluble lytic murein transglycosylase-like protein